jgi:hypothetical protein
VTAKLAPLNDVITSTTTNIKQRTSKNYKHETVQHSEQDFQVVGRQGGGGNHACAELQKLQGIVMLKY